MKKAHIQITQMLPNGSRLRIEIEGKITSQAGNDECIAAMLLEAEMHGNAGKARIHLDMS